MTKQEILWEQEKFEMKMKSLEMASVLRDHLNRIDETIKEGQKILKGVR